MSSQPPELESLIAALQSDLPSERERERMRARLLSAGVAVAAGGTTTGIAAEASALASQGAAAATTAKVANLSVAGKLGWTVAVIASASALSIVPLSSERDDHAATQPTTAVRAPGAVTAHRPAPQPPSSTPMPFAAPAEPVAAPASPVEMPAAPVLRARPLAAAPASAPARAPSLARALAPARAPASAPALSPAPAADAAPALPSIDTKALPTSLREEAELLEHALAALHAGDRAGADRWLAAHERRFPQGALRRERERAHRHLDKLPAVVGTARSKQGGR